MSERTRILVFAHSPGLAGAERSLLETLELLRADHDITLVVPGPGPFLDQARKLGLADIRSISQHLWYEKQEYSKPKKAAKALVNLWAVLRAWRLARATRPALVYSNSIGTWTGALVARLTGRPHVWHLRELVQDSSIGRPVFGTRLQRSMLAVAGTRFLCNSAFVREWYAERFGIQPVVAYQPVQVPPAVSSAATQDRTRKVISVFGRLQHEKRQHIAVEAIARLPAQARQRVSLHLYGAGSSDYTALLQDRIARNGLDEEVRFKGYTNEAHKMMLESDLVLVPSVDEAFGRVAAEAMLLGVPLVGASSGGTLELIGAHNERGLLFPADDSNAAAGAIEAFLRDPQPFFDRARAAKAWAASSLSTQAYIQRVGAAFASAGS